MEEGTGVQGCIDEFRKVNDGAVSQLLVDTLRLIMRYQYRGNPADDREFAYLPPDKISADNVKKIGQFVKAINDGDSHNYNLYLERTKEGSLLSLLFRDIKVVAAVNKQLESSKRDRIARQPPRATVTKPTEKVDVHVKPAAVAASMTDSAKSEQEKYLAELRAIVLPKRKELEAEQKALNERCTIAFMGQGKIKNSAVAEVVHQRFHAILSDKDAPKPTADDIKKIVQFAGVINKPNNFKEYMKALNGLEQGSFSAKLFGDEAVKAAVKAPPKPQAEMEMSTEMAAKAEKAAKEVRKEVGKEALKDKPGSYNQLLGNVRSIGEKREEEPKKTGFAALVDRVRSGPRK